MPPSAKAASRVAAIAMSVLHLASATAFVSRAGAEAGQVDGAARQRSDAPQPESARRLVERVGEFLAWAHPPSDDCGPPSGIVVVALTDSRLRADFETACKSGRRALAAILETREGMGVWQVFEGFEADAAWLDQELKSGAIRLAGEAPGRGVPGAGTSRPGIAPPPADRSDDLQRPALPGVLPPQVIEEVRPELPEEAGRARFLSEARVELLVEVSLLGTPERTRPLRGPEPDLGLHRAASEAVLRWRFRPATAGGRPLRYFAPVVLTFEGLPPEARSWVHRALFHVAAIVSADSKTVEEARSRVVRGEPFEAVTASLVPARAQGGDWGFVSASTLPAAVRKALHEVAVGEIAGPIASEGLSYLVLKRGEIYYAIRGAQDEEVSYQILHQQNAPEGERLRRAVQGDIADYLADSRRLTYMNEAARLMGIRQRQTEIGQLEIHTDSLDDEEVKVLGRVIDATIEAHRQFWESVVPLRPFKQKILVYAFARKKDHERLRRIWRPAGASGAPAVGRPVAPRPVTAAPGPATVAAGAAGEYVASSRVLAIPCEEMQGHLPVPILVHEAIHMLDYERVYGSGVEPSRWFEEGLATYFGFSQMTAGLRIEPGSIHRSGTIASGDVMMQFDPRVPLRDYQRRISETEPVPLRLLLAAGPSDPLFRGDRATVGYGAAWTLVHFLEDGAKGRRRPAFLEYARLEARGEGGPAAFERLFGPDLDAFETAWREHDGGL